MQTADFKPQLSLVSSKNTGELLADQEQRPIDKLLRFKIRSSGGKTTTFQRSSIVIESFTNQAELKIKECETKNDAPSLQKVIAQFKKNVADHKRPITEIRL